MAVAEKKSPPTASSRAPIGLVFGSLVGAAFVLASFCAVAFGIPWLWWDQLSLALPSFVNVGLFLLLLLAGIAVLGLLGRRLIGPHPAHGLKAGVFWVVFLIVAVGLLLQIVGVTIENWLGNGSIAWTVAALFAVILIYFLFRPLFRPGFEKWLGQLEDQGWFTTKGYKASQGQRVRRGTILGILILGGCGIYTLISRNPLLGDLSVDVPFADGWELVLLPARKYALAFLLSLALLWLTWRAVNLPVFADFLVATEAEMNKVSWTTRRRLIQDSIVVLTTVLLMTLFLLVVDILWFKILSAKGIGVLYIDTTAQKAGPASEKPEY
jgi:preprotein translocase SecE subunit